MVPVIVPIPPKVKESPEHETQTVSACIPGSGLTLRPKKLVVSLARNPELIRYHESGKRIYRSGGLGRYVPGRMAKHSDVRFELRSCCGKGSSSLVNLGRRGIT